MTTVKTEVKEIVIFKELTTNEYLADLKAESEKYTGLYVDMNKAEERKYVKDKADGINKILKQLDRKRIDLAKDYKAKVEAEAADIKERLEIANLPFTLLIDEHKAERKKILDAEKAEREAIELAAKIEADHEYALLMNDKFDSDKIIAEQQKKEYEQKLKDEAAAEAKAQAEIEAKNRELALEKQKQDAIDAEARAARELTEAKEQQLIAEQQAEERRIQALADAEAAQKQAAKQARLQAEFEQQEKERIEREEAQAREQNKAHKAKINNVILDVLKGNGIPEEDAKTVIKLAAQGKLPNVKINY